MRAALLIHEVTVETHLGAGAYGDTYSAAVPVRCLREEVRRLVRDAKTGEEVVSEVTIFAPIDKAPLFTVDSRVTWAGVSTHVLSTSALGGWWPGSSVDHVEVSLA